jgi:hypothetical protein
MILAATQQLSTFLFESQNSFDSIWSKKINVIAWIILPSLNRMHETPVTINMPIMRAKYNLAIPNEYCSNRYNILVYRNKFLALWYISGLRAGWWGVRVPVGTGNFSLHHRVQTGSGVRPASYPMGTRGSLPGGEADHSPPSGAKVKNTWSYTSTPQYAFVAWFSYKSTGVTFFCARNS